MSSKTVKGKDLSSQENLNLSLWMLFLTLPGMFSTWGLFNFTLLCSVGFVISFINWQLCALQNVVKGKLWCYVFNGPLTIIWACKHFPALKRFVLVPETHLFPLNSPTGFLSWVCFPWLSCLISLWSKTRADSMKEPFSNVSSIAEIGYWDFFISFLISSLLKIVTITVTTKI